MALELCTLNEDIFFKSFKDEFLFQKFIQEKFLSLSDAIVVVLDNKKRILLYSREFSELVENVNPTGEIFTQIMKTIAHLPDDFFKEKSYFIKVNSCDKVFKAEIEKYGADSIQTLRYVIILKDVSDKNEMQIEKDNFIATLTHDLKTPVRAGILSLELLQKGRFGELNNEQAEIISELLNSNKFIINMIDTLLAKFKYENDEVQLNKLTFDINEFIKGIIKELKCLFDEKQLTCTLHLFPEKIELYADNLELKRAFLNLISNAIKFNNDNGKVEISIIKEDNSVKVIIRDTGLGMSKDKLEHIFDKYVSYAKKFRRLGTGLGLYVAKKIILAHSGSIEVSSKVNEGSTFIVTLPLKN